MCIRDRLNDTVNHADTHVLWADPIGNTLTVDRGAWSGSDGSGYGPISEREGAITQGLPISGTGNFNGNSGTIVDVSNSNQEWVNGYFIKAASTRTGLAILRTKAIKAGTEIAQAVSDIKDGDFAIVDNNYWFKDEDTLIDLGPVNLPSK